MNYTQNYNLNKPDYTDAVDIPLHYNENMDVIDEKLKEIKDDINTVQESTVGPTTDNVINVPLQVETKGQVSVGLKGETISQLANNGTDYANWEIGGISSLNSNVIRIYGGSSNGVTLLNLNLVKNKEYTLFYRVIKNTLDSPLAVSSVSYTGQTTYIPTSLGFIRTLTITSDNPSDLIRILSPSSSSENYIDITDIMIVEGDWTTGDKSNQELHYLSYGTKSTVLAQKMTSVGKNLFDGEFDYDYIVDGSTGAINSVPNTTAILHKRIKSNTKYILTTDGTNNRAIVRWEDANKNLISHSTKVSTNPIDLGTSPSNAVYVSVYIANFKYSGICQLELGTTATEYEPYTESISYLYAEDENGNVIELHSVGTVKDEVKDGKVYKRNDKKVLGSAEFNDLYTGLTNVDVVRIYKPSDSSFYNKTTTNGLGQLILEGYSEGDITTSNWDSVDNIGKYTVKTGSTVIDLFVAKGTYADLTSAQADLAGTTLIYQLEQSYPIPINVTPLIAYPGGTIYFEPVAKDAEGNWIDADPSTTTSREKTLTFKANRAGQIDGNTNAIIQISNVLNEHEVMLLTLSIQIIELQGGI